MGAAREREPGVLLDSRRMTRILGISAYYHDAAAALLVDGRLVAAAQEERFTRRRHDASFPAQAVRHCLAAGGLGSGDLDAVVFYDKPFLKFERLLETYLATAPYGLRSFVAAMPVWLKEKLFLKSLLKRELARLDGARAPPLLFSEHHLSHAASAFYPSPFEEAAVLCLDGVGEWATASAWHGRGARLTPLWEQHFPHSLGLLYTAFTTYAGFRANSGEYKLMGLAPYGEPRYVERILEHLVDVKPDGSFRLDMRYFDYATGLAMTNARFAALLGGPPRAPDGPLETRTLDLARSIQEVAERIVLALARTLARETGARRLCLAGGVALNCVANARLKREGPFEELWIQPAAGDAGGAVGAAYLAWHQHFGGARRPLAPDAMQAAALGPSVDAQTEAFLEREGIAYERLSSAALVERTAELLADGAIVGWVQGPMEFGPRALGHRSILADPRSPAMQHELNLRIKLRESFRPFAPSVPAERANEYFVLDCPSPYMLLVAPVRGFTIDPTAGAGAASAADAVRARLAAVRSPLPAVTHVDGSARVQTVARADDPLFHALLEAFGRRTGIPVLVNTSFNVRGEPIVCSPADAYRCFMATAIDWLAMGPCLIDRRRQDPAHPLARERREFAPD